MKLWNWKVQKFGIQQDALFPEQESQEKVSLKGSGGREEMTNLFIGK